MCNKVYSVQENYTLCWMCNKVPSVQEIYTLCWMCNKVPSVQEIHKMGLGEVERIEEEMKKIVKEMGQSNLKLSQFTDKLRWRQQIFSDFRSVKK